MLTFPQPEHLPNVIAEIGGALIRDKAAIVGAAASAGTSAHVATITYPTSLESWGAILVSAVTIIYVISKIFILWVNFRNRNK